MARFLALLWLTACSAPEPVQLPPRDASVRTVILVLESPLEAQAYPAALAPAELDTGERALTVLHYSRTLEELGFREGLLEVATGADCASAALTGWSAAFPSEPNQALTALRFVARCPCVTFDVRRFELGTESVRSILPYDSARTLLVTPGALVLVDIEAGVQRFPQPVPLWASFEDQQGRFWFGDIFGQLWFGDPLGELTRTFTSSATRDLVGLAGEVSADRFELLAVTKDRILFRFDGERWEELFRQRELSTAQEGTVVYLRPGRATATLNDGDGLVQYDDRRVIPIELEEWSPAERGHLLALEQLELGLLLTTRTGRHFLRAEESGPLEELAEPVDVQDRAAIYDVTPFLEGFLEVGQRGYLRQWHPSSGFCPGTNLDYQINLEDIAPLGQDGFVTGGSGRQDQPSAGFVLRPLPAE